MAKIGDVGTLRELDVKPGDRVMHGDGTVYEIRMYDGEPANWDINAGHWGVTVSESVQDYRLISRAQPDTPTIWRDMTDAEKGALLLAAHEGKVIEVWGGNGWWSPCSVGRYSGSAYRIKPEPVRETVTMFIKVSDDEDTPIGTIDLIDGKPVIDSVKMEEF